MITYHFIKSINNAIKNTFRFGFGMMFAPIKFIKWLGGK